MGDNVAPPLRVRQALEVIGGKWVSDVLDRLSGGPLRYSQLQREVRGVSTSVLTRTLRRMERDGLINRAVRPAVPPEVEYSLTLLGVSLDEPLTALADWAEGHLSRTVGDLVTGSDYVLDDRGAHALKGIVGEWQRFAVQG